MGNYNPVYKSLWTNQKFSGLESDEKLVFLHLLTNEKTQQTGIYQILPKQIACDCNLDLDIVTEAIQSLISNSLIVYWEQGSLIYIHKFFKFSKGMIKNPNILKKIIDRQRELIKNSEAWKIFDSEFKEELASINTTLVDSQSNSNNSSNNHSDREE